jgi:pseudaminic acid cytidylyltransferase
MIAVILARGGSKRLPRKNIKVFDGQPILLYPLQAAHQSGLFGLICVSSDDEEILDIARDWGAYAIRRPAELANDTATTAAAMRHAVEHLASHGVESELACCMYPCTPFVLPVDFHDAFNILHGRQANYVFPVTAYAPSPFRMLRMHEGMVSSVWPEFDGVRNQDLELRFHDGGQWYLGRREAWALELPIYGNRSAGLVLPRWRCIDIDTIDDWEIAEAVYQAKVNNARGP